VTAWLRTTPATNTQTHTHTHTIRARQTGVRVAAKTACARSHLHGQLLTTHLRCVARHGTKRAHNSATLGGDSHTHTYTHTKPRSEQARPATTLQVRVHQRATNERAPSMTSAKHPAQPGSYVTHTTIRCETITSAACARHSLCVNQSCTRTHCATPASPPPRT
jgi:hypothetical protein